MQPRLLPDYTTFELDRAIHRGATQWQQMTEFFPSLSELTHNQKRMFYLEKLRSQDQRRRDDCSQTQQAIEEDESMVLIDMQDLEQDDGQADVPTQSQMTASQELNLIRELLDK